MSISIFNLLISVWYSPFIYFDFEVFIPSLRIKKRLKFSLKYPQISVREKFWKVWNESAKIVTEDDDMPF